MARKSPKGIHAKTEGITLRVSPRTKFTLDLAARIQRRTLSSVVGWAIAKALDEEDDSGQSVRKLATELWHPHEAIRMTNIAKKIPSLLSYEEDLICAAIAEDKTLWRDDEPNYQGIRERWDEIKDKASHDGFGK